MSYRGSNHISQATQEPMFLSRTFTPTTLSSISRVSNSLLKLSRSASTSTRAGVLHAHDPVQDFHLVGKQFKRRRPPVTPKVESFPKPKALDLLKSIADDPSLAFPKPPVTKMPRSLKVYTRAVKDSTYGQLEKLIALFSGKLKDHLSLVANPRILSKKRQVTLFKESTLRVLVDLSADNPMRLHIFGPIQSFFFLFKNTLRKGEMEDFTAVTVGDFPSFGGKKLSKRLEKKIMKGRRSYLKDLYKDKTPRILTVQQELEYFRSFIRRFFPGLSRLHEDWDVEQIVNWMVKVWDRLPKRTKKVIGEYLTVESA